jgi:hypothetical protein
MRQTMIIGPAFAATQGRSRPRNHHVAGDWR